MTAAREGIDRRTLLRWAGLATGGLVVASGAGLGVRAATNGVWAAGALDAHELWARWRDEGGLRGVVAAGVLAASPHNTQPWLFDVHRRHIDVLSDPDRFIPVTDPVLREHHAGLGCAIENMVRAAPAFGYAATVSLAPEGADSPVAARLELLPAVSSPDPLYEQIDRRRTNRGPYAAREIPAATLERLRRVAAERTSADVRWLTRRADLDRMSSLIVEATQAITEDEAQSRESAAWFRSSRADVERYRDGITLDAQALGDVTLAVGKILPAQSREEADRFWVNRTETEQCATAAAYGVIVVGDVRARADRIAGGRGLQALHLAATAEGLGLHPMNQITERIDRDRALGRPDRFEARFARLCDAPVDTLLLSFRIGYPERSALPSPRRRLEDVILSR